MVNVIPEDDVADGRNLLHRGIGVMEVGGGEVREPRAGEQDPAGPAIHHLVPEDDVVARVEV